MLSLFISTHRTQTVTKSLPTNY